MRTCKLHIENHPHRKSSGFQPGGYEVTLIAALHCLYPILSNNRLNGQSFQHLHADDVRDQNKGGESLKPPNHSLYLNRFITLTSQVNTQQTDPFTGSQRCSRPGPGWWSATCRRPPPMEDRVWCSSSVVPRVGHLLMIQASSAYSTRKSAQLS